MFRKLLTYSIERFNKSTFALSSLQEVKIIFFKKQ